MILGVVGKSAQIGFHAWLADAMEGPTPVSALLHAATMVTAGVFLVLRSSIIFEYANLSILIFIGSITCVYAGLCALVQYDIKKIIAYSTCSQLGYMLLTAGLNCYSLSISHLINHAFFKALLFLSAGAVLHIMYDEQDLRKINKLFIFTPFISACFIIGTLAIIGFPSLTGFYSKDVIIELAYSRYIINGYFAYTFSMIAVILTSIYSIRLLNIVFISTFPDIRMFNNYLVVIKHWECNKSDDIFKDVALAMFIPMFILMISSIIIVYLIYLLDLV